MMAIILMNNNFFTMVIRIKRVIMIVIVMIMIMIIMIAHSWVRNILEEVNGVV